MSGAALGMSCCEEKHRRVGEAPQVAPQQVSRLPSRGETIMTTVGTGAHTYELVDDWAQLPAGWTLGQTGIVTDARDRVYLFNRSAHPLMVLDRDGTFFTSWGEGVLSSAHGMFIDQHEHIYLPVINSHVVLKYSPSGNLLMTLGTWNTLYGQKIETCQ